MLVVFLVTFGEQSFLPIGCHCCDVVCHVQRKVWTDRFFFISVQADEIIYRMTQKKRSSPKIEQLPNFYLDWHKTSATLGQACVADISKVSSLFYKNSLFHWRPKNVLQMSAPALQAHLDPARKLLDGPPAFLPWDRSCCCCDCCLQVRHSLWVVAIHPVLKVSPQIKIWGIQVRWMWRPLRVTPAADQSGGETLL